MAAAPSSLRLMAAALAASSAAQQQLAMAASVPAPYDCHAEYEIWETAWTPDWKAWCCEHEARGCPSTMTATETSTTRTSTTQTTSTRTATATTTATTTETTTTPPPDACETPCLLKGVTATCRDRIHWSAAHDMKSEVSPCEAARALVLFQCKDCGACSLKAAQCKADVSKKLRFQQKFKAPQQNLPATAATAAATGRAPFLAFGAAAGLAALVGAAALRVTGVTRRQRSSAEVYLRAEASESLCEEVEKEAVALG